MIEAPHFLQVLARSYRSGSEASLASFKVRLDGLSDEVNQLKAEAISNDRKTLFVRYLEVLDDKCAKARSKLARLDPDDDAEVENFQSCLKEVQERLSIARRAAKAHFEFVNSRTR